MVTAEVRIARAIGERVLRRQDEVVAIGRDELSDEPLRRPVRVVAGRVDEVAAGLDVAVEDATALLLRRAPAPVLAEGHRAEAELRDAQAASSEQGVAHRSPPLPVATRRRPAVCPDAGVNGPARSADA